jgi:hypothetical protein
MFDRHALHNRHFFDVLLNLLSTFFVFFLFSFLFFINILVKKKFIYVENNFIKREKYFLCEINFSQKMNFSLFNILFFKYTFFRVTRHAPFFTHFFSFSVPIL